MLLLKVGIVALNYKKFVFKIVTSPKIELSIKFKTTKSVLLSLSVRHARFLDHTDFCLKYFWLSLELSCTMKHIQLSYLMNANIFKSF